MKTITHKDIEITIGTDFNNETYINWSSYGGLNIKETKDFIEALKIAIKEATNYK